MEILIKREKNRWGVEPFVVASGKRGHVVVAETPGRLQSRHIRESLKRATDETEGQTDR
jgi:hypothetical protein